MSKQAPTSNRPSEMRHDLATRIHQWLLRAMQIVMAVSLVLAVIERHWLNAVVVAGIVTLMSMPAVLGRRFTLYVPAEFQLLALVFVFAALFLGEVRGYYHRFWWWDIALHTTSGLLLGILGFLLIYVLNEDDRVDLHLRRRFVALFAFLSAIAVGAIQEILEFGIDQVFGMNMQKPMLRDPSGKTDTMWDLIVDTVGAVAISGLGWWYITHRRTSFIDLNPQVHRTQSTALPEAAVTRTINRATARPPSVCGRLWGLPNHSWQREATKGGNRNAIGSSERDADTEVKSFA